uniref:HTH cro/C1-type domain-containing protein n=1 Tax=Corethron hystrix TaxID=216773 RepID=A0A6U5JHQ0_9STRA|mmetsp:Transcript_35996/g.84039  ORF Transcript_35996/g.84039 Transcript_35996/m.84039 type:complete len:183 (+) Transcript_35996:161-709(+)|eukprot:CAMPEP_0113309380 /NCGR_PEP_ID=MMETSP0010_2-20120614/7450_1 /TAXON_ID=216773 ORGANISM="Corethron hystrix, Strain 308" /NCGR_SAMPLE_ID=MMETSP0010_2 /ASSEMBLY_ACC=CAM_ASM_000155 /LENGTH=182 /DNA_ID=CAMNT_0000164627 /DNA_START=342 /DNA_END=890 /DNA_ORIENTATION=+ /assembly_acc=CAM_ASM_000155
MPQKNIQVTQDFTTVSIGRTARPGGSHPRVPQNAQSLARAKAMGLVTTEKKFGGGSNSSAHTASVNARKIEDADTFRVAKVDRSLSKAIQQARMAQKMSQKDLATKINEKPQIIGEYESGKAIPNGQIISKIERALNCKLPRPGKKPAGAKGTGPKKATAPAGASSKGVHGGLSRGGPAKRR